METGGSAAPGHKAFSGTFPTVKPADWFPGANGATTREETAIGSQARPIAGRNQGLGESFFDIASSFFPTQFPAFLIASAAPSTTCFTFLWKESLFKYAPV